MSQLDKRPVDKIKLRSAIHQPCMASDIRLAQNHVRGKRTVGKLETWKLMPVKEGGVGGEGVCQVPHVSVLTDTVTATAGSTRYSPVFPCAHGFTELAFSGPFVYTNDLSRTFGLKACSQGGRGTGCCRTNLSNCSCPGPLLF